MVDKTRLDSGILRKAKIPSKTIRRRFEILSAVLVTRKSSKLQHPSSREAPITKFQWNPVFAIALRLEPFNECVVRQSVKFLLLPLLLAPTLLFADGLTDVRAALQKLQSDQPIRARVEIKTRHSGGESSKQKQSEGVSSV